jgi:tripartite-type tricarboxylate transporter receptor subunit TctC
VGAAGGTPAPVIKKLQDEMMAIVKLDDIRQKMLTHEVFPVGSTSEEYTPVIARELVQWSDIAKKGNIKIQ